MGKEPPTVEIFREQKGFSVYYKEPFEKGHLMDFLSPDYKNPRESAYDFVEI